MNKLFTAIISIFFICCASQTTVHQKPKNDALQETKVPQAGLLVVDAQKFFIPGHPESIYVRLNDTSHYTHTAERVIPAMVKVINWANSHHLPTITTYEAKRTDTYGIPTELTNILGESEHFVKMYYDASKHPEFMEMIASAQVNNWFIIGAETDVCIYQTALGLLNRGHQVALVLDAIYSGRNDTSVALNNLLKAGARTVSYEQIDDFIFEKRAIQLHPALDVEKIIITIVTSTKIDTSPNSKRLKHLRALANVTGISIEEYPKGKSIPQTSSTRIFAGAMDDRVLQLIAKHPSSVFLVDSITGAIPTGNFQKQTVKMFFYMLMQSAELYHVDASQLKGWKRSLKQAFTDGDVLYLESTQNY